MTPKDQIEDRFKKFLHGDQLLKLVRLLIIWTKETEIFPHVPWFVYEQDPQPITREWDIYDVSYVIRQSITYTNQNILTQY